MQRLRFVQEYVLIIKNVKTNAISKLSGQMEHSDKVTMVAQNENHNNEKKNEMIQLQIYRLIIQLIENDFRKISKSIQRIKLICNTFRVDAGLPYFFAVLYIVM